MAPACGVSELGVKIIISSKALLVEYMYIYTCTYIYIEYMYTVEYMYIDL